MIDAIFNASVTYLEEMLIGSKSTDELHLLLASPGGDGEVAIRLVKMLQASCSRLTIIVPDMAKSAATLMCLGADEIVMAASSDLGPIDPQFLIAGRGLVSAKEIQRAVMTAEERVSSKPGSYELYASLLADVNMLMVEQATSALDRTGTLLVEALRCVRGRKDDEVASLAAALKGPLIDESKFHGATIGPAKAHELGLPIRLVNRDEPSWDLVWNLWTRYFELGCFPVGHMGVYEGSQGSQVTGSPVDGYDPSKA
ncbi:MAG: SDH family Clp fold serine proteinase [Pseudonocardiales bacterium]